MKRALMAACLLFAAGMLRAGEIPLTLFNAAADSYSKGNYREAITQYESFAAQYGANAELYYNLGNALYRDGQMGRALVNYERAHRLAPRDSDIRANRGFVRQQVKEPEPPVAERLADILSGLAALNTMLLFSSLLLISLIAGIIAYLFTRRRSLIAVNGSLLVAGMFALGLLYVKINHEVLTRTAIIIAGPADVRNGPDNDSSIGFTLPEGRTVTILGESGDWAAVGLPAEGLRGWIEKKNIMAI